MKNAGKADEKSKGGKCRIRNIFPISYRLYEIHDDDLMDKMEWLKLDYFN